MFIAHFNSCIALIFLKGKKEGSRTEAANQKSTDVAPAAIVPSLDVTVTRGEGAPAADSAQSSARAADKAFALGVCFFLKFISVICTHMKTHNVKYVYLTLVLSVYNLKFLYHTLVAL